MASATKYKKTSNRTSASTQLSVPRFLVGAALGAALAWVALKPNFTTGIIALMGMAMAAIIATLALRGRGKWRLTRGQTMAAVVFGVASLAGAQAVGSSFAADDCHPQPKITKMVQNTSEGALSPLVDANSPNAAIKAKPGDILTYVISVTNVAQEARDRLNDMVGISITDTLPEGVERVDLPNSPRTFTDRVTDLIPRVGVVKTYKVKVTATTDGLIQKNNVCLTSNGIHGNKPSRLCDVAYSRVVVPPAPPAPAPAPVVVPPTPVPDQPIQLPAVLPQTGPGMGNLIVMVAMAIVTGYVFSLLFAHMKNGKKNSTY